MGCGRRGDAAVRKILAFEKQRGQAQFRERACRTAVSVAHQFELSHPGQNRSELRGLDESIQVLEDRRAPTLKVWPCRTYFSHGHAYSRGAAAPALRAVN